MINDYWLYITLAFTVTAIPGPAIILTIKNSILYGSKIAGANIAGNFVAMLILASVSAMGLGAIILASHDLFYALKVLGCIYLVYLGIKAWRAPVSAFSKERQTKIDRSVYSVFKEGFTVGIANPKAIAFFTALFPQFINLEQSVLPQYLTLIFTIEGISILVMSTYALVASAIAPALSREKPMKFFNKLAGTAFISFGVALVYER